MSSTDPQYAERLSRLEGRSWKRFVPNPYRWHIRHVATGRVLDVGCGIGRCLAYIRPRGIGVDPSRAAVEAARTRGLDANTPEELLSRLEPAEFDTLLCSHVLEHLDRETGVELVSTWLPRLRPGGKVVLICPQERGQASDATHVRLMDPVALRDLCGQAGVVVDRVRSFPFPAWAGRWWVHNETVLIGHRNPPR